MHKRTNQYAQRFNRGRVITITALCCLLLTAGVASLLLTRERSAGAIQQPVNVAVPVVGVTTDQLIPSGMPVTIAGLTVVSEEIDNARTGKKSSGPAQLKFRIQPQGREKLTSVNLMLFEFDEKGVLYRVDGWVRNPDFARAGGEEVILDLNRRVPAGRKLMLTVERLNGEQPRETVFQELAQAANGKAVGNPVNSPGVSHRTEPLPDESGADLCNNALRRAVSLMQSSDKKGDKSGITSLRCDQQDRSFTFTYGKPKASK